MAEFYLWPRGACYLLTLALALCVLAQTLAVMVSIYRHPRSRGRVLETLLELLILGQVFVCSLLHGQAVEGYDMGLFAPGGYNGLRVAFFAMVALAAALTAAESRRLQALPAIAAACLTLPAVEQLTGRLFAWLYVAALLFWLARGVFIGLSRYGEIKSSLSMLSVKNAMDSLNTGVVFYENGGFIVLCNQRMQRLMAETTGEIRRNGEQFIGMLAAGEISPGCALIRFEGQNACRLPNGSVWLFNTAALTIKRKQYTQLTATDITERWELTAELQAQNEELTRRQAELLETLNSLQALSREREAQRARMRAHDILGGRLTLLLRAMHGEPTPDYERLCPLTRGLMDELKAVERAHSPQDDMDILKQTFEAIGVGVLLDGELPPERERGQLFVDISKEAVTNAVRHGYATRVTITMGASQGRRRMRVTDNGQPPAGAIKEGGGLSGMRSRLAAFGGALSVTARPAFTLTIDLPEEKKDA